MKRSLFLLLSIVSTSGIKMKITDEPTDEQLIKTYIDTYKGSKINTSIVDDFGDDMIE